MNHNKNKTYKCTYACFRPKPHSEFEENVNFQHIHVPVCINFFMNDSIFINSLKVVTNVYTIKLRALPVLKNIYFLIKSIS